jgi:hypothetical protein
MAMRIDKTRGEDTGMLLYIITSLGVWNQSFNTTSFVSNQHMFVVEKFKSIENLVGAKLAVFHHLK